MPRTVPHVAGRSCRNGGQTVTPGIEHDGTRITEHDRKLFVSPARSFPRPDKTSNGDLSRRMKWGLSMDGLEGQITEIVTDTRKKFNPCTYMEIGVASGGTLAQVSKILGANGKSWRSVGVELPNGYSFKRDQVDQNCTAQHLSVGFVNPSGWTEI